MNDSPIDVVQAVTKPRSSSGLWIFLGCAVALFLLPIGCIVFQQFMFARMLSESAPLKERVFDADLWKSPQPIEFGRTTRSEMVDDLLSKHSFVGWTREEVEELLGPGEKPLESDKRWDFIYYMGMDRSFLPFDNEWLGFILDENSRVLEAATCVD